MIPDNDLDQVIKKAEAHWTDARLAKFTHKKHLILGPREGAAILRVMGLMNRDGSIAAADTKKFLQINHMLQLLRADIDKLAGEHKTLRVLDAGCGNSFMTLLLAWYMKSQGIEGAEVVGVDHNPKVIEQSRRRAEALGYSDFVHFHEGDIAQLRLDSGETKDRFHLTLALHACDTATDHAVASAIKQKSDVIAIAPCCQRELSAAWEGRGGDDHPLAPLYASAQLRREAAATMTDMLRILMIRARGYEVTATEFVPSAHTPKNRLILARRRGQYNLSATRQYESMRQSLGAPELTLERLLKEGG